MLCMTSNDELYELEAPETREPPYTQTITGSLASGGTFDGRMTLTDKQSSPIALVSSCLNSVKNICWNQTHTHIHTLTTDCKQATPY